MKKRYLKRLYNALKELLIRFHHDWVNENIDKSKVKIVTFNRLMSDFDNLMFEILDFLEIENNPKLEKSILETAEKQKAFTSKHHYNLEKFGLTKSQIKQDCEAIYNTFLNGDF